MTTLGNLSGFVAPYMVGVIIETTGGYRPALAALGVQSAIGALILFVWRGSVKPWRQPAVET